MRHILLVSGIFLFLLVVFLASSFFDLRSVESSGLLLEDFRPQSSRDSEKVRELKKINERLDRKRVFCEEFSNLLICDNTITTSLKGVLQNTISGEYELSVAQAGSVFSALLAKEKEFRTVILNSGEYLGVTSLEQADITIVLSQDLFSQGLVDSCASKEGGVSAILSFLKKINPNLRTIFITYDSPVFKSSLDIVCGEGNNLCFDRSKDLYIVGKQLMQFAASCSNSDVEKLLDYPSRSDQGYSLTYFEPFRNQLSRTFSRNVTVDVQQIVGNASHWYDQVVTDHLGKTKIDIEYFGDIPQSISVGNIVFYGAINYNYDNHWMDDVSGIKSIESSSFSVLDDLGTVLLEKAISDKMFYNSYEIHFKEHPEFKVFYKAEIPIPLRLIWLGSDSDYLGKAISKDGILLDEEVRSKVLSYYTSADGSGSFAFLYNSDKYPNAFSLSEQITSITQLPMEAFSVIQVTGDGYYSLSLNSPIKKGINGEHHWYGD